VGVTLTPRNGAICSTVIFYDKVQMMLFDSCFSVSSVANHRAAAVDCFKFIKFLSSIAILILPACIEVSQFKYLIEWAYKTIFTSSSSVISGISITVCNTDTADTEVRRLCWLYMQVYTPLYKF
jgi:hypothetical protein